MKIIGKSKSEKIWDKFVFLSNKADKYNENSEEYTKLNKMCWELLGMWQEEFLKEFLKK